MSKYYYNELEFTLFYDGLCPICSREAAWLIKKNKRGRLGFQDINDAGFDPSLYGTTLAGMMAEIHGVYPDGRLVKGMDVFRAAYTAVGLGWLLEPTDWPVVKPMFNLLYWLFSKYRIRLARLVVDDEPCNCGK
ncbi:MAG: DUF393 domain-containing protein [Methylococcales bacterium]|nr:DUF393 domain-containing protein [Methylococcales bacterium]